MEQSLVMYRISKVKHKLDGYIGAQPLSNDDDGKVTALTVNRWEAEIADNLKEFGIGIANVTVLSFQKLDDIVVNKHIKE